MTDEAKIARDAKLVAEILTDNGMAVRSPDEGHLDALEMERWRVCREIARRLNRADQSTRRDTRND